jgi:hypothetical protein
MISGKTIAIAGIICGVNYAIFHQHPEIAFIAAAASIPVGLFWYGSPERLVISLLQAGMCIVLYGLAHGITYKFMTHYPQWWQMLPFSLLHGFLGGAALGAMLGGMCRYFRERGSHEKNHNQP